MTKEAEIGDRYNAAKVVKTTTFGAFVELVKGTDGLLHISNVKPGERVDSVDDVLTAGDVIDVTVVEVDRERGRIGLRLSEDPSVAGKIARGAGRGRLRRRRPRGGGGDRRRPRWPRADGRAARRRPRAARRATALSAPQLTELRLGRPGRHRGGSLGALGRARALGAHRLA